MMEAKIFDANDSSANNIEEDIKKKDEKTLNLSMA